MKKLRVIVCGTGFGAFYLNALNALHDRYEVVGILARGSKRSKEYARKFNLALYTDFNELDKLAVDAACVVVKSAIVGGSGTDIALRFLQKGIHVLQEQPIHYQDYARCLKAANDNHCCYQVNTFYNNVEGVKYFLDSIEKLRAVAEFTYIKAECSIQVLFPLIDILGRMLGGLHPWKFKMLNGSGDQEAFAVIDGMIKEIPVIILIDNKMDTCNPETNISLLHRISLGTSRGTLQLTDTQGAVLWNPNLHENIGKMGEDATCRINQQLIDIPVQEKIYENDQYHLGEIFERIWPDSVERSLADFYDCICGNAPQPINHQQYLYVCQLWKELGDMLGTYKPVKVRAMEPISLIQMLEQKNGSI